MVGKRWVKEPAPGVHRDRHPRHRRCAAVRYPNAQFVAAELLCRNAKRLHPGQSSHWPSSLEGCWITTLSQRAELLIVEAIVIMTLDSESTETALRSAAVRLYGHLAR